MMNINCNDLAAPKGNVRCRDNFSMILSNPEQIRVAIYEAKMSFFNFEHNKRESVYEYLKGKLNSKYHCT